MSLDLDRVRENRLGLSCWVRNFGVPDVGWRVIHAGISGLSALEDFRAAEFDLERKLTFSELEQRPLN